MPHVWAPSANMDSNRLARYRTRRAGLNVEWGAGTERGRRRNSWAAASVAKVLCYGKVMAPSVKHVGYAQVVYGGWVLLP